MMYNGVKPRFDGKGTEFGRMHRWLGKEYGMCDFDLIDNKAIMRIKPPEENNLFAEYKVDFKNSIPVFNALFDLKHYETDRVKYELQCKVGTSIWAQYHMCKKLECRFFIVIANYGIQPFKFIEINEKMNPIELGTLTYIDEIDGPILAYNFWKNTLKL